MVPELHVEVMPGSEVEVCAVLSLLTHVTVVPFEIVTGLGLYAVVVFVDEPATIDTLELDDGVVGVVIEDVDPHAAVPSAPARTTARMSRLSICAPFRPDLNAIGLTSA